VYSKGLRIAAIAGAGVIALAALSYWSWRSQLELERRSSDSSQPR